MRKRTSPNSPVSPKPTTIIRVVKDRNNPYTMINRRLLENNQLSFEARGMLAYLLSKPDDWVPNNEDLKRNGGIGDKQLARILRELKETGHLHRERHHQADGRYGWVTMIYEVPQLPYLPNGSMEPYPQKAGMDKAPMDEASMDNGGIYLNTDQPNTEVVNTDRASSAPAQPHPENHGMDEAEAALFNGPKITTVTSTTVTSPVATGRKLTPGVNAPRRAKQIPLPANYPLTDEMRAWAAMEYPALGERIDTEHKKFCNHARSTGKLLADWRPAWENWMINAAVGDFAPKVQGGTTRGTYESKPERNERIIRNRIARWQTAESDLGETDYPEPRRLPA